MSAYFGRRIARREDPALLIGSALFVDDVGLPGMLHAAFLRSDLAHAEIRSVDASAARDAPGVIAVFTATDLGDYWQPGPLLVPPPPVEGLVFNLATQVPLARDKVRHAGEAIAVVVAESRYLAEDALDRIAVDMERLPAVVDLESALDPATPVLHPQIGSNLAGRVVQTKGDYAGARATADLVLARRLRYDRGAAAALENRGVVADWQPERRQLTVWDTTQCPIPIRAGLAEMLGLSEHDVRVISPFVGGAFGPKSMRFYPEEMVLPWLTMRLGRPVKWIEDRAENFYATNQERLQIHDAEIAVRADGTILGISDRFLHDSGAYDPYGLVVPVNSQCTVLGCYDVPNLYSELQAVFTTKPMATPVRGAGHQHGTFVIERLLDRAAAQLGLDRIEIRRRNLLRPEDFPHHHGIYKSHPPLIYDSGNFEPALDRAAELIGYEELVGDDAAERQGDQRLGVGVVTYIEGTGVGPYEGAQVAVEPGGRVRVSTGIATQGQGHHTSLAQIVAEALAIDIALVDVVTGDTGEFHRGSGTFASRSTVVAGNACLRAAQHVRAKAMALAAVQLGVPEQELVAERGGVWLRADRGRGLRLGELAARVDPGGRAAPGSERGLEATAYFGPEHGAMASGVHAIKVEVDLQTCNVRILDYVVVHDCGRVLNPLLVEGQVHGGVAHGIGNAFYEQLVFDRHGQLRNATLGDYLVPSAMEIPRIRIDHIETAAPGTPLGVKGAGESGGIATGAAFAQAVEDALGHEGLEILEIPLSPNRLFELLEAARSAVAPPCPEPGR